jgi:hypothetical protein
MAKKVDEELADPYMREIAALIPNCLATKTEQDPLWTDIYGEWQIIDPAANAKALGYESSIDLSGYANQYLTFFPEVAITQETAIRSLTGTDAGGIIDATVITTVPMTLLEIFQMIPIGSAPGLPEVVGLGGQGLNYENVLYCRVHTSLVDTTTPTYAGFTRPIEIGQTGSLEATAADKLYVYRIVIPITTVLPSDALTTISCCAQRIALRGTMAEEPTIEYMMRLKRSYELANQV